MEINFLGMKNYFLGMKKNGDLTCTEFSGVFGLLKLFGFTFFHVIPN